LRTPSGKPLLSLWRERPPHVLGYFQVGDLAGNIARPVLQQEIVSTGPINPLQIGAARGDSKVDLWIEYVLAPVIRVAWSDVKLAQIIAAVVYYFNCD